MRKNLSTPPSEYIRRFYYDTVVFGADYLGYLAKLLGASQLVAGTDGPVDMGQPPIAKFLADAGLSASDQARVAGGNAERLLGLS